MPCFFNVNHALFFLEVAYILMFNTKWISSIWKYLCRLLMGNFLRHATSWLLILVTNVYAASMSPF